MKVVIVGGVAGGASAAARLRRLDERAEIVLIERGEFISFANCGLPYYVGGEIDDREELTLQTPESFTARFNVDVRTLSEVTAIDRDKKAVTVQNLTTGCTYTLCYDKLILSPGAMPVTPRIDGVNNPRVFTIRTIPDAVAIRDFIDSAQPERAVVVGGGYIGVEMAENLKNAGLDVTIVEMADHVIASIDCDMACDVHNYLQKKGVHLLLSNGLRAIRDGGDTLTLKLQSGELTTDMVILAIGVKPETQLAKRAWLTLTERGAIVVNDAMQTSDPDIYAVGDAVSTTEFISKQSGYIPLAGPANKQGRIAADNICGIDSRYTGTQGSAVIKIFDMTVAVTGLTESAARERGFDADKSFTFSASHAGYYPGGRDMSIKTVFERGTGKILGAQLVGYDGVDKRCDVLATAIRAGMTARELTTLELCYAPPFSSAKDPVNFAGYVIENLLRGAVNQFHWHDVAALPRDGSVTLLDVRTPGEYASGHIDGFVNIELDALRDNLSRLDVAKPAYVHCRSGLRSYLACRILTQNGFDCYNLSGGYRLYDAVVNGKLADDFSCYKKPSAADISEN
jgi:NADPH-dependent 2,4-dienoyl-CoA reductase/sulfur reductase-like enzyme